jgi:hypothetical protein
MSDLTVAPSAAASLEPHDGIIAIRPLSVGQVLPWLLFAGLLLVVAMYFVGAEQGATSLIAGNAVHEWTHDGRHLLGFPCH